MIVNLGLARRDNYLEAVLQFKREQVIVKGYEVQRKVSCGYTGSDAFSLKDALTHSGRTRLKVRANVQLLAFPAVARISSIHLRWLSSLS